MEAGQPDAIDALQRLWTPWRMAYIRGEGKSGEGCPFCVLPTGTDDAAALILKRGTHAYAILNAYPYNPGHLMAVPYRHVSNLDEVTEAELHEMADLCQAATRILRSVVGAGAFNVGINVGGAAGAGIADHIHQHVVPRWGGDTNFMPVIGQTRVLPELLEETYRRLAPAFADL